MKSVVMIPARMASTRFPGKPIARIQGRTMVEHVYRRARLCSRVSEAYVATCDDAIARACAGFGAPVIITSAKHERASDRIAEAARKVEADIYVMVQGDEPMITPEMIDLALEPFAKDPSVLCVNLAAPIGSDKEFRDPNTIKVVIGPRGDALYFSREPIPSPRRDKDAWKSAYKQVCVIPFRGEFLKEFTALKPTPLEILESIDMLRALEHGRPVRLVKCAAGTQSVDTPADLERVEKLMARDPLCASYAAA